MMRMFKKRMIKNSDGEGDADSQSDMESEYGSDDEVEKNAPILTHRQI